MDVSRSGTWAKPEFEIAEPADCRERQRYAGAGHGGGDTNYECVVVINNTPDTALWLPIEEHCRALGERFKFVRADDIVGFKAGALRLALIHTAADAEVIAVIDADYVVHPDWLRDLVPFSTIRPLAWCKHHKITAMANAA